MDLRSKGERVFDGILAVFMVIISFLAIYPLWYVIVASFSSSDAINEGRVFFFINEFNLSSYKEVFQTKNIFTAYGNTFYYSIFGTLLSMVLTLFAAYPLSKKRMHFRKLFATIILITMWFGAGMMPTYINIRNLGLLNTRIGILIHGCMSAFYVILARTFFEAIPEELEESVMLDGGSDWQVFWNISLPLSKAMIATLTLYYFVGRWNSYFWPMVLLTDADKIPLQVLLKKLVVEMNANYSQAAVIDYSIMSRETMVYSTIVISIIPMIIIYPFIQKYFVSGVMIGAVKG